MGSDFSVDYEKTTWVHKLDPRTKLVFILVFATVPLFFTDFKYLLICAALIAPVWITAKIDVAPIKALLVAIIIFSLVTMVFATFYNYNHVDQKVLFKIGFLTATDIGFYSGLMLGFRAAIPSLAALILICTTDPANLAKAMMIMKIPLSVAFMMMGALKMFPLVFEEMQNIKTAQIIRGVKYGSFKQNFVAFRLAVLPLMVNTLRKSRVTGIAVESKGFGKRAWNEYYQEFSLKTVDYVMLIACVVIVVAAVYVRFVLGLGLDAMVTQA
ncbi:energy-coupling factor transporter transmembrane component T [Chakrabartyella piscis]|uniref:energy-coupling factor transporter transmembrane component T family protein n=1 Tax=Chakrabartyella piscis TaxID=2918914 RepID=UPI002958CC2E|nr:energy-coupling factor transporter transmembrane component T [Chakrabartyella piscis]